MPIKTRWNVCCVRRNYTESKGKKKPNEKNDGKEKKEDVVVLAMEGKNQQLLLCVGRMASHV